MPSRITFAAVVSILSFASCAPSKEDVTTVTSDLNAGLTQSFDVGARLTELTAPTCAPAAGPEDQFAYFHREQVRELHSLWFGLGGLADRGACAADRLAGASRQTLMRCDLA